MSEPRFNTFGKRVRILREDMGLTQDDVINRLAEQGIKMRQSYLSELERTDKTPTGDMVAGLAKVFNTTTDYLLLLNDDPSPPTPVQQQMLDLARSEKERELLEELVDLIRDIPESQQRLALEAVQIIRRASRRADR
jgi:transcriptional regulator with XRE-family HTH domain